MAERWIEYAGAPLACGRVGNIVNVRLELEDATVHEAQAVIVEIDDVEEGRMDLGQSLSMTILTTTDGERRPRAEPLP